MQIGDWGHLSVIVSLLSSLIGMFAYYQSIKNPEEWKNFGRVTFIVHALGVFAIVGILFSIIYTHNYRYHYAWSHASNDLPWYYMLSCFWEGQEGSFLLWIFWNVVVGAIVLFTSGKWESRVMTIFFLGQAFLVSMILGVVPFDLLKLGSSPFVLLSEVFPIAPVFQDPTYIPADGNGLNPLLQNYWMVIHPPTLFLGFSLTFFPYAFCMAGLWEGKYTEWLKPALPWTILSSAILGLGILMGGYWAYETLNFGGYWNWDPVENAVFIPWIVQIGALHMMILYKRSQTGMYWAIGLVVATFVLILYSTFLTRSGILGESSVHSFTSSGLDLQLLSFLFGYIGLSLGLIIYRHKHIPTTEKEATVYTIDFWLFLGVIILLLSSFQIFFTTSLPVFNKIFGLHLAPPIDAQTHYSKWQVWFAIGFSFVAGTGQYYWWNKKEKVFSKEGLMKLIGTVLVLFIVSVVAVIYFEYTNGTIDRQRHGLTVDETQGGLILRLITYVLLLAAGLYVMVSSVLTLRTILKTNKRLAGGAIAHIGFAMMLIGILFSSGYSKVVSLNKSTKIINPEFSDEMNTENVFLRANETSFMNEYQLAYLGKRVECDECPVHVDINHLFPTNVDHKFLARIPLLDGRDTFALAGDTLTIKQENTYFEVEYKDRDGDLFTLFPRAQINPAMGGLLASPDIKRNWSKDLYTHISSVPDHRTVEWGEVETKEIKMHEPFLLNGLPATLDSVKRESSLTGVTLGANDLAITAYISIQGQSKAEVVSPTIIWSKQFDRPMQIYDINLNSGLFIDFVNLNPETGIFTFAYKTTERDYIILKAIEKPLINILWIGTIVLMIGFFIATYRRYKDYRNTPTDG